MQAEYVKRLAAQKEEIKELTDRLNDKEQEVKALNTRFQEVCMVMIVRFLFE